MYIYIYLFIYSFIHSFIHSAVYRLFVKAGCQYAILGCWGAAPGNAGLCWRLRIWFGLKMIQWAFC